MGKWFANLPATIGVPQTHRLVFRRGDDALAVGAERSAIHTVLMPDKLSDLLAGFDVPQSRRLIPRRRDNACAVGAERGAFQKFLMACKNDSFSQTAPSAVERKFTLG